METFQLETLPPDQYIIQDYSDKDINLLEPIQLNKEFGLSQDGIEMIIFNSNGDILDVNYNHTDFKNIGNINNTSLYNSVSLDPENDLLKFGYSDGQFDVLYTFYRNLFSSSFNQKFYIKEISLDRKEIKIINPNIDYLDLQKQFIDYISIKNTNTFYYDFEINFGDNNKYIGVNIALDNTNTIEPGLYIKLYEPLPTDFNPKDTLWLNEILSEPVSYRLNKTFTFNEQLGVETIKGPNFNIDINQSISTSTPYLNISNIVSGNFSSSLNQLESHTNNININIDYGNFNDFIHFSSAKERLENFIYKITQIQNLENDILLLSEITGSNIISGSIININNKKNEIIKNLDGYEYYLYYTSGSNNYPKSGSQNLPYNSSQVLEWLGSDDIQNNYYGGKILEASNYDIENRDYLWNNLPDYIKFDEQNESLKLFISMLGQHFDYLWTYSKDITNKNINDNRLTSGISKDLVADALQSLGIKLYTNSQNKNDIFSSFLENNYYNTGSMVLDNYITSSNIIPSNDIQKEVYKRLYHNIPYLLKSKGTKKGLRALINCFGIPDTILRIKEYGGNIKELDITENQIEKFNYSLTLSNSDAIYIPFYPSYKQYNDTGYDDIYPDSLEFRFKLNRNISTQSLLESNNNDKIIKINANTGSLVDINFGLSDGSDWIFSENITLPLFNDDWWNISLSRETGSLRANNNNYNQKYTLIVGNKNNNGIEYIESKSIIIDGTTSSSYNNSWSNYDNLFFGGINGNYPLFAEIQEFRYWINDIPLQDFKNHILNPRSISLKNPTSSYDNLIFRIPFGSELNNTIQNQYISIHPSDSPTFISGGITSSNVIVSDSQSISYSPNYEIFQINSPNNGLYVESNEKIKILNNNILTDNVLSKDVSIILPSINQIENSSNIEVSFSPTDIVNDDIIDQLGNFNIDDYIGDPLDKNKTLYPDLEKLKRDYYKKYLNNQTTIGLIQLLSSFDNSLFKMIKDFIPAKANPSTGLVIKSNILDRNKIEIFEPTATYENYNCDIKTAFISGGNPLDSVLLFNNTTSYSTPNGNINIINNDNKEIYNGEIKGSNITIHSQSQNNIIYEINKLPENNHTNINKIILNPILNNIDDYPKNKKLLNIEYGHDINTPSNINYITSSLIDGDDNKILYSGVQSTNYTLTRFTSPRFSGCKMISKEYNIFNKGDISYGSQPVIDYNKIKFAYFEEITSQSLTFPDRSNVYIKYLIDKDSNITELSKQNKSIFDIQSIFNVDKVDIILDNNQSPSKQKQLDGLSEVFAGGYKFLPILQNLTTNITTTNTIDFVFENDIAILNNNTSSIIQNLPNNSLLFGAPFYEGSLSFPNTSNSNLIYNNNFKIKFPVTRNTPYPGEIRQKIIGTLKLKIEVSPFSNFITKFYNSNNGTGVSKDVVGIYENPWLIASSPDDPLFDSANGIRSILVPSGSQVIIGNSIDPVTYVTIYNTPGLKTTTPHPNNYPLCLCNAGVDYVKIIANSITGSYTLNSYQNDFGGVPTTDLLTPTFPLEDQKFITLTFNINGEIIIPDGSTTGDFYLLKPNTNIPGVIQTNIKIQGIGGNVKNSIPTELIYSGLSLNSSSYFFTNPPEFIYQTGSSDYGFNSGSSPSNNWYFERVNSIDSGSFYNKLISSYYLSKIIYEQSNNSIIQSSPDMVPSGYESVEDYLNIKVGDLIRFWNHDKNSFPKNFENEIKNIILPLSEPSTGSYDNRFIIEMKNEIPNQACLDYFESGSLSKKIQNFIFLNKQEDETNIIINKPKREGETSSGIILPFNIDKQTKNNAGNIIKQLKNQNLI